MALVKGGSSATNVVQHSAFPRLEAMWRAGKGCDVTIMCKNNQAIKAHSLVLCSVSDKLDELLLLNADKMINSLEVEAETWEALLEVIYTGQFTYKEDVACIVKMENMLSVAQSLGMTNIVEQCQNLITERAIEDDANDVKDCKPEISSGNENVDSVEDFETKANDVEMAEERDKIVRKKKCIHCKDKCRSKKVKCCYCFRIVENDISHMDKFHPFTPSSSMFAYSCRFIGNDSASKDWTVFTKVVATQDNVQGVSVKGFLFQCLRCDTLKPSLDEIMKHANTDHGISAKVCKVCHTGFLKKVFVKDHENFCKGEDLLKCDDCGKEVGGFHALWSHIAQHKHGRSLEGKGIKAVPIKSENAVQSEKKVLEFSATIEIEDAKVSAKLERQKVCMNCNEVCQNKWVKCVYCERIVFNSTRHMDQVHPFTPKNCVWAYYCKYSTSKGDHNKVSHVCSKETMVGDSSSLKYVCQKCKVSYKTLNMIDKHLKIKHNIHSVFHCAVCDMGFNSSSQLDDHIHFCKGGDISTFSPVKKNSAVEEGFASEVMNSSDETDVMRARTGGTRNLRRSIKKPVRFRGTVNVFDQRESDEIESKDFVENHTVHQRNSSKLHVLETEHASVDLSTRQRKALCTSCGKNCKADLVHCLYCLKLTDKDSSHMETEHPFTLETSYWVYNCKQVVAFKPQGEDVDILLFRKESPGYSQEIDYYFQCRLCDLKVDTLDEIASHIKSKHSVEPYICGVCGMGFATSSVHGDHEYFCKGGRPLKCNVCGSYFAGHEKLMHHNKNAHKSGVEKEVGAINTVTENSVVTAASSSVPGHDHNLENTMATEVAASTDEHGKDSGLKRKVKEEKEEESGNGVCSHCCRSCDAVTVRCLYCFKVVDNNISHKELGHPHSPSDSVWVYTCQLEKDEQYSQSMIFIKESIHKKPSAFRKSAGQGKMERFKCLQCDNNFTSMDILLKHVVHQFRCLKCKLIFTNKDSVKRHVELMHNQTSYRCENCESGFLDSTCYEDHGHLCGGGHLMSCSGCGLVFWRVSDYKDHMAQHHPCKRVKLEESQKSDEPPAEEEVPEESDVDDPMYTGDEPIRRVGRGRPKKRMLSKEASAGRLGKDNSVHTDEDLQTCLREHFEEVHSDRLKAHQKMCLVCEGHCLAEAVKCGYCGCQVKEPEMDSHMAVNHPMIPATSLWIVTCRCYRVGNQLDHLARQIIEQQQVTNENNVIEEGVYMSLLAGYECVICDAKFTGDNILQHLRETHKNEAYMCETCGLVMKSDGKINVHDHMHMCAGGEILKCKECDKRFASWHSANKHRKLMHMESKRKRRTARSTLATKIVETPGEHGYLIRCVDCDGTCHTGDVKCMLCLDIVPKDDLHMKLKHAYSPSSTWVVTCRYSIPSTENQVRGFAGGKVAASSESELLEHQQVPCTLNFHYKCYWCDALFSNKKEFKEHIRLTHYKTMEHKSTGLVMYYCKHCDAVLIGRSYFFSDHVQFCSKGEVYQCDQCHIEFCYLQKVHLHLKKKHPEAVQKKKALKAAAVNSNGKVPMSIPAGTVLQCAECSFSTKKLTLLKRHNKLQHKYRGGQLHQLCRFCFKVFRVRSDRERHEQSVHLGGQEVVCHICGQSYEIPNQLERHMYYYHKGGREYLSMKQKEERKKNVMKVCGYCGKEYTIAAKLNRHIRVVHEKSLEFKCSVCLKEYGSRDSLRIHENKHRGNKPYSCPYCSYKDYRGYIVNSHVEREHPGREKPYKRVSVFQPAGHGLEEEDGEGVTGGFEPQQLVVEYVKTSGQEEDYSHSAAAGVIQLQNYTIEDPDNQHQFVEAVQRYEVQQECSDEIEIPSQQIEVKEIAVDNLEEVTTAGEVLMEYYVT